MGRIEYFKKLSQRLHGETKTKSTDAPSSLKTLRKAQFYEIEWSIITRLNYFDLLGMLIERDIESLQEQLQQKERERRDKLGHDVVKASNEDIIKR